MKHQSKLSTSFVTVTLCTALHAAGSALPSPTQADIEKTVNAIRDYDYGRSRKPLLAVEKLINRTHRNAALRAEIEKALIEVLQSDASLACKQFICRKLWIIGTDASVPALTTMLAATDTHAAEAACYALSRRRSPAARQALRDSLSKTKGNPLIAVVNLLGDQRDAQSAEAIASLAESAEASVADAAIAALGKIASGEAVKLLAELRQSENRQLRTAANHASLQCAQELAARGRTVQAKAIYEQLAASGEPPHIRRGARIGLRRLQKSRLLSKGSVDFSRIRAVPLFDGETFVGWEGNLDIFRIEDGAIVGGTLQKRIPRNEFLCTKKEYRDFELRLKAKLLGPRESANAGIQIRSRRIPNHHEMIGYQADMGQSYWGNLYDESRRRKLLATVNQQKLNKVLRPGGWNDYVIRCVGKRIQLWINGHQTVDYTEPDNAIEQSGIIGLQIHAGPPSEAWYKDITIKELP